MSILKVFVYGTLKPGERNYPHYCQGEVQRTQVAFTWGQLYNLSLGYPAMIAGNTKVKGVLLTFKHEAILRDLDELESDYHRRKIPVYDIQEDYLGEAWSYFMTIDKIKQYKGRLVETGWWCE